MTIITTENLLFLIQKRKNETSYLFIQIMYWKLKSNDVDLICDFDAEIRSS